VNGMAAITVVLGLLLALAWVARRGGLGGVPAAGGALTVERGIGLGERRSLVIVHVEGRRFLLGLTPATVSLVTELDGRPLRTSPEDAA
jgi:flagellar protein FliO/FliZ